MYRSHAVLTALKSCSPNHTILLRKWGISCYQHHLNETVVHKRNFECAFLLMFVSINCVFELTALHLNYTQKVKTGIVTADRPKESQPVMYRGNEFERYQNMRYVTQYFNLFPRECVPAQVLLPPTWKHNSLYEVYKISFGPIPGPGNRME